MWYDRPVDVLELLLHKLGVSVLEDLGVRRVVSDKLGLLIVGPVILHEPDDRVPGPSVHFVGETSLRGDAAFQEVLHALCWEMGHLE